MAAEVLRRAVEGEVAAVLERPQEDRRRGGGVADDRRGVRGRRLEVGHRQERVRRRLEPDEVRARRRRPGLVELDEAQPPALQRPEQDRCAVVGAFGERDRLARARAVRAPARWSRRTPTGTAAPARLPALRARPPPLRRSGARSAGSTARRARRPRTARSWSGRAACGPSHKHALGCRAWRPRTRRRPAPSSSGSRNCATRRCTRAPTRPSSASARPASSWPASAPSGCATRARSSSSTATCATARPSSAWPTGGRGATRS